MKMSTTYLLLLLAATLEAAGDAIVRAGLHNSSFGVRVLLFALGAGVLFTYGVTVNSPPWDFGKLLGVYVTLFFVVAQFVNFLFFHVRPDMSVLAGGALVVAGGLVITLW